MQLSFFNNDNLVGKQVQENKFIKHYNIFIMCGLIGSKLLQQRRWVCRQRYWILLGEGGWVHGSWVYYDVLAVVGHGGGGRVDELAISVYLDWDHAIDHSFGLFDSWVDYYFFMACTVDQNQSKNAHYLPNLRCLRPSCGHWVSIFKINV